jgi:hypothetical protein
MDEPSEGVGPSQSFNFDLSLLNNPSGRGIGLAKKTATDDVRLSNRAMLSCDADSPHVF